MNHHCLRVLSLSALLAIAPRSQEGLAQLLPADAKFVCYIDLQAAIDLVGRDMLQAAIASKVGEQTEVRLRRDWSERVAKEWGIDPMRDLQGVLIYGNELGRQDPAVTLLASANIDGALDKLREMGVLEGEPHDGGSIDRISAGKMLSAFGIDDAEIEGEGYIHVRKLSGRGPQRAITFDKSASKLMQKATGARGAPEALALSPRPGCIVYLEVADALRDVMGETPASRMANKAKHLAVQVSHADGELQVAATVEAESQKDARQIAALVNGLKALLSLMEHDADVPEAVIEALSEAQAETEGSKVTLQFKLPRSILDQALEAVRAEVRSDDDHDDEAKEERTKQPKPGARSKRAIR